MPLKMDSKTIKRSAALGIASATLIALPFIGGWEGRRLVAYLDPVGIATICDGETYGVKLGDIKTHQECDAMTSRRVEQFAQGVDALIEPPMEAPMLAAYTSFAYNVGISAFAQSSIPAKMNAGNQKAACDTLLRYVYAGRKANGQRRDCRDRANNCYGLVYRRNAEHRLCLEGIK